MQSDIPKESDGVKSNANLEKEQSGVEEIEVEFDVLPDPVKNPGVQSEVEKEKETGCVQSNAAEKSEV